MAAAPVVPIESFWLAILVFFKSKLCKRVPGRVVKGTIAVFLPSYTTCRLTLRKLNFSTSLIVFSAALPIKEVLFASVLFEKLMIFDFKMCTLHTSLAEPGFSAETLRLFVCINFALFKSCYWWLRLLNHISVRLLENNLKYREAYCLSSLLKLKRSATRATKKGGKKVCQLLLLLHIFFRFFWGDRALS